MTVVPSARAAIIAVRCEIDLSPGKLRSPRIEAAEEIFIKRILERLRPVCLDSERLKPLTYNEYIVNEHLEFNLPSRIESVDQAAADAETFARSLGFSDDAIYAIDLAVRESVANAVKHGNKFDDEKPVEMTFAEADDGLEITVRDFGTGFSVDDIPDPTDRENLLKATGRGILFMRSFMDEVDWAHPKDGGIIVKMVKKR
jgi:serine/threonine-protein kinase RsbW